ncbi:MAG TPA: glucokinase [Vicinamibacterales bacterium]|nr:glucokinase [Vicinamibacterales bacterium]
MLLAGDVGGTKTLLGFYHLGPDRPEALVVSELPTLGYPSLEAMVRHFLSTHGLERRVRAACFGVAGPVRGEAARLTNVPWSVDADALRACGLPRVRLINDLVALARAVPVLQRLELIVLQEGEAQPDGNAAVIAAGTGLGEAVLHNIDGRFEPMASEAGHADFAARTPREFELVAELTQTHGRAQVEAILSGPGLINLFHFTHPTPCAVVGSSESPDVLPALISASALGRRCPRCVEALDLFVSAYGAEAGNLALRAVATAGVYVGGGIAPRILPALESGLFLDAFRSKPPMVDLLAAIPVYVIMNPRAGLLGAAVEAADLLDA